MQTIRAFFKHLRGLAKAGVQASRAFFERHRGLAQGGILLLLLGFGAIMAAAGHVLFPGMPVESSTEGGLLLHRLLTREQPTFSENFDAANFSSIRVFFKADPTDGNSAMATIYAAAGNAGASTVQKVTIPASSVVCWQQATCYSHLHIELEPSSANPNSAAKVEVMLYLAPIKSTK